MQSDSPAPVHPLASALIRYARRNPDQHDEVQLFLHWLAQAGREPVFTRDALAGHFTGSAWLVDRAGHRVLLTHHRKLNRWLQLGGHADGEQDLARVALREAEEESGLGSLDVEQHIFDIDRHRIPARGDVPEHWHYDVRYVVRCRGDEQWQLSDESLALEWVPIDSLLDAPGLDDSMRRMARKWLSENRWDK